MSCPLILSSQYKEFNRSIEEDNYFQLKTDKNTGKPYKPDVFQTTSANYLYNNDDVVITCYKSYAHPQDGVVIYKISYKDKSWL